MEDYDLIVIGGGPAGMAAALAAAERGVSRILLLERANFLGGILQQCIHTGFGLHYFKEELSGPEYAERFIDLMRKSNIVVKLDTMVVELCPGTPQKISALNHESGWMELTARAVVLAMGCRERSRGALSIPGTRPAGVLSAGTAQKYVNLDGFLPGQEVVILGSGDIGLIMARRMTLEGAHVKMVCEVLPYSGGLTRNIVQCLEDFGIPLKLSHTVTEIHGQERLTGVTIAQVDEQKKPISGTETFVSCDLLLLSVGLIPENELTSDAEIPLDLTTSGAFVDEFRQTKVPGIFSCGNVLHVHDLVDYVTLEAQLAGAGAAKFLAGTLDQTEDFIDVTCGTQVRYVVPQRVRRSAEPPIDLYFRVGAVMRDVLIRIRAGETVIKEVRRARVAPGEMETITLSQKELSACAESGLLIEII